MKWLQWGALIVMIYALLNRLYDAVHSRIVALPQCCQKQLRQQVHVLGATVFLACYHGNKTRGPFLFETKKLAIFPPFW